ncbi:MAG: T9SS type A sorting domain-containing protein [Bacteroidetes bacterium]|nr:T9SS type A sorting domain-containing protein [Bacteroidota bacterium]HET6244312.1 T9SS type A sorting domain-containing protein [Bacteroidia bacterium]
MASIIPLRLIAQQQSVNLVSNPSFEEIKTCPWLAQTPGDFEQIAAAWSNPTANTPDIHHECGSSSVGVPYNMFSFPQPVNVRSGGLAYAGVHTLYNHQLDVHTNSREYIQTEIYLKSGIKYNIRYFVRLSDKSGYATKMGFYISTTRPTSNNTLVLPTSSSGFLHPGVIQHQKDWNLVEGSYDAESSGIHYLTIGNFDSDDGKADRIDNNKAYYAYYYIDDVSVTAEVCCLHILNISNTDISSLSVPYVASANHTVNVGLGVTVQSGANAIFTAGSSIEFSSDFDGTDFEAYISPCPEETQIKKAAGLGPTIITPYNTGGDNNQLCLNYVSGATSYIVEVYTTTGALVYSNTQFIIGLPVCVWNGKSAGGNPVAEAVYEVEITLKGCDDKSLLVKGSVKVSNSQFMIVNNSEFEELVQLNFAEETFDDVIEAFNKKESMVKSNIENTEKNIESSHSNYKLFPNPSSGIFDIQLPLGSTEPTIIRIFNGEGKIIFQEKTFNDLLKVNISCFARGTYYLKAMKGEDILIIEKVIIN